MLRPHGGKNAQFGEIGRAPQDLQNAVVFVRAEPVLGDHLGGDRRIV